ncbi:PPOX class F420-dependent oxidoreductase [Reyranella sp. CPCC 100927]|uniref:PPOX class F420-dependent oxidoreductase n=1 Tax=Reyranella sp. CPCC 100927 TaxID=2599616 RepID=UPI0011B60332|nr:PPOX class F420-dependent oxidoreductase [Reyranella sp. CPCC 100927]TWS97323.1 PPOX class F420-dependent oxidoreductase [Reyranella sp. CPCC 100927]
MPADVGKYQDLLTTAKALAHLATRMADGSPQVTPVWFDWLDGKVRVNTARGRVKDRNMQEGNPVALSIVDPANPYRYVQIRGTITRRTETGAEDHINQLSRKYTGDTYKFGQPGDVRVMCEITPTSVSGMG